MDAGTSEQRVAALDGLRGIAIGLVVLFHLTAMTRPWASTSVFDHGLWKLSGAGWAGVDLFFVLSGFLITGILYDAKGTAAHYFRSFYARRVLRIFPLYYAFLLLLIVGLPFVLPNARDAASGVWHSMMWYGTYTLNVRTAFWQGYHPDTFFAGHVWSLAVEEQFYLVWPFVVLALNRRMLMAACVGAIAGALVVRIGFELGGAREGAPYGLMPSRMDGLAAGALIALIVRDPNDLRRALRWLPLGGGLALAGLLVVTVQRGDLTPPLDPVMMTLGLSLLALAFAAALLAVLNASPASLAVRALSHGALRMLGRYSYALYLFHVPVGYMLIQRTGMDTWLPHMLGSNLPSTVLFTVCGFAASVAVAALSWQVLEQQCFKLKRYFPYSGEAARPKEDAAPAPILPGPALPAPVPNRPTY